jgi:hypothetical protein
VGGLEPQPPAHWTDVSALLDLCSSCRFFLLVDYAYGIEFGAQDGGVVDEIHSDQIFDVLTSGFEAFTQTAAGDK